MLRARCSARCPLGFDIVTTEDTAAWTAFLRFLVARGLAGVELVISDAHGGIKAAMAAVLSDASWQRCRTHYGETAIMWTGDILVASIAGQCAHAA